MHNKKRDTKPVAKNSRSVNRKERRKELQAKPPKVERVIQRSSSRSPGLIAKRIFTSLLFWVIVVLAAASFLFVAYPRVSAYPGKGLIPGEPFQTSFTVRNDGYWPIRDLSYSLSLENVEFGQGNTIPHAYSKINETSIPGLSPGNSSTISLNPFIDLLKQSFGIVLPPKTVTSAEISVHLSYRSYLIPHTFTGSIHFTTDRNSAGEYVWSEHRGRK